MESDPIGLAAGGANVFEYVDNNPIIGMDSLGLYDFSDFGVDALSFAAGLGDAVTFGGSTWVAKQTMTRNDAMTLDRTKRCSKSFRLGQWASVGIGAGRIAYAALAKGASIAYAAGGATMADAEAASAFRTALKRVFRVNPWSTSRIRPFEWYASKYRTAKEIIDAAGRTSGVNNAAGAVFASGGTLAVAKADDCGCDK